MKKGKSLALIGALLQFGLVFGLLGTVIGMLGAFKEIKEHKIEEENSTEALAESISLALNTSALGILTALAGIVMVLIALFAYQYRAPWFFWFLTLFSIMVILLFPIGTVVGIVVLVYIMPRKKEFWCEPVETVNT